MASELSNLIHAAAGVSAGLVFQVQVVMLGNVSQFANLSSQCRMLLQTAPLAAVGLEVLSPNAQGNASPAAVAIRPVSEQAAAPEAFGYQF